MSRRGRRLVRAGGRGRPARAPTPGRPEAPLAPSAAAIATAPPPPARQWPAPVVLGLATRTTLGRLWPLACCATGAELAHIRARAARPARRAWRACSSWRVGVPVSPVRRGRAKAIIVIVIGATLNLLPGRSADALTFDCWARGRSGPPIRSGRLGGQISGRAHDPEPANKRQTDMRAGPRRRHATVGLASGDTSPAEMVSIAGARRRPDVWLGAAHRTNKRKPAS